MCLISSDLIAFPLVRLAMAIETHMSYLPSKVHPHVAAIGPTQVRKRLRERREATLLLGIAFVVRHEHADAPHAVALLRPRRERPGRRAAEKRDELAPPDAKHGFPPGQT